MHVGGVNRRPSPERLAELSGMTIPQILHSGRQRAALADVPHLRTDGP
jgi:hypothetical protein